MSGIPLCFCHNEKMFWEINRWRCRIDKRQRNNKYINSPKGYITRRMRDLKKERKNVIILLEELRKDNPWLTTLQEPNES